MLFLLITIARKVWSLLFWLMPMTHSTEDARRAARELSVVHPLFMYGWPLTFFVMKVDPFVPYKVTAFAPRKGRQTRSNSWLVW